MINGNHRAEGMIYQNGNTSEIIAPESVVRGNNNRMPVTADKSKGKMKTESHNGDRMKTRTNDMITKTSHIEVDRRTEDKIYDTKHSTKNQATKAVQNSTINSNQEAGCDRNLENGNTRTKVKPWTRPSNWRYDAQGRT